MSQAGPLRTFREDNQFRFTCPIFKAEVAMKQCLQLRDLVWKGKRLEVRRGCQACMRASKCPIVPMVQDFAFRREPEDVYYSAEPRVGSLLPSLLARIAKIIVPDRLLNEFTVPTSEAQRIVAANTGITHDEPAKRTRKSKPATETTDTPAEPDALTKAAMTGDMSAALNKAMENDSGT